MKTRPDFLHRERTRHGKFVWYFRRQHGARIRLRAAYDTPEFWAEYRAALEGTAKPEVARRAKRGSFEWAIDLYRQSSAWAGLKLATRRQRENIYRAVIEKSGEKTVSKITAEHIRVGRERRAARPHAANNFLKAMRGFFEWAAGDGGLVEKDPTREVKLLKGRNDETGFHTWTEEEVERFEKRWAVGTRERLALDILLYTGLRRGDAVVLGRQHVRDGVITIRTEKTGDVVTIPMLQPLAASIAATKTGDLAFLVTERGGPFVKESFGNWFRKACREADVPGSAHGLRKAGATRAAENGASERELMAIFGWSTGKMAQHYTQAADRKRLAMNAGDKLLKAQTPNKKSRTSGSGAGARRNSSNKTGA